MRKNPIKTCMAMVLPPGSWTTHMCGHTIIGSKFSGNNIALTA